jgi:hypothetical protein
VRRLVVRDEELVSGEGQRIVDEEDFGLLGLRSSGGRGRGWDGARSLGERERARPAGILLHEKLIRSQRLHGGGGGRRRREATLDHHARGVSRRAEPDHVGVSDRLLARDAVVVDENPAGALLVVHRDAALIDPEARRDGVDARELETKMTAGIRSDPYLVQSGLPDEPLSVQGAAEHRERRDRTGSVGHQGGRSDFRGCLPGGQGRERSAFAIITPDEREAGPAKADLLV